MTAIALYLHRSIPCYVIVSCVPVNGTSRPVTHLYVTPVNVNGTLKGRSNVTCVRRLPTVKLSRIRLLNTFKREFGLRRGIRLTTYQRPGLLVRLKRNFHKIKRCNLCLMLLALYLRVSIQNRLCPVADQVNSIRYRLHIFFRRLRAHRFRHVIAVIMTRYCLVPRSVILYFFVVTHPR